MKHGKFEAKGAAPRPKGQKQDEGGEFLKKPKHNAEGDAPKGHWRSGQWRLTRRLLILLPLLLVLGAAVCQLSWMLLTAPTRSKPVGMTKEEILEKFRGMAQELEHEEMNLTLYPSDSASSDAPIVLSLSPEQSRVRVDMAGLEQDLKNGVGKVSRNRYVVFPADYISLDRSALRKLADQTEREWAQSYLPSFSAMSKRLEGDREFDYLTVNIGKRGREISADRIYDILLASYYKGELTPSLVYETRLPKPLDVEKICRESREEPVDAVLNLSTFEITPDIPGSGILPGELEQVLAYAHEGVGYVIPFRSIRPAVTVADVEKYLYGNILAAAHTPHTRIDDRTKNLMLACEAINGTVVMPSQVFSFNETVGERTAEKGYREAIAYIAGNSVPEIGGGVCQVASSIYYATLQADLPSVERYCHTYLVTYVPQGMDAAIYWNRLDFKFRNTSPYPIKIEATVSDGEVHILLRGREWKDYTVELSYEIMEEIPYEVKERAVYDDSHKTGDVLVSPYTGYLIATYKSLYDFEGKLLETQRIAYSRYSKRDKVVAVRKWLPTPED